MRSAEMWTRIRRGDSLDSRARAVVNFASASDTDVGTLKTYTELHFPLDGWLGRPELRFQRNRIDRMHQVNAAFGELAGFRIGRNTSFTTYLGYGGEVMQDWVVRYGPFERWLDLLHPTKTATVSARSSALKTIAAWVVAAWVMRGNGGGYVSNVVAGLAYDAGAFGFRVVGGYDECKGAGAIIGTDEWNNRRHLGLPDGGLERQCRRWRKPLRRLDWRYTLFRWFVRPVDGEDLASTPRFRMTAGVEHFAGFSQRQDQNHSWLDRHPRGYLSG